MFSIGLKRCFSVSLKALSHIGSQPIFVPPEVKIEMTKILIPKVVKKGTRIINLDQLTTVTGPKGTLDLLCADFIDIKNENGKISVSIRDSNNKIQKSLWGTTRSHLQNYVTGVTEGHLAILKLVGTGYRAQIETKEDGKQWVMMKVGRANMEGLAVPEGITVSSPSTTRVIIEGANKQQVTQFAASLRLFRPPEPYKGKGIYVNDETIKLKVKKIK